MKEPTITAKAISLLPALPAFLKTYRLLKKSQWWSRERLENYQLERLEKLLNHAYDNVPYYRRVLDERGLKPKDIRDFNDLQKLPFLTKEIIRDNLGDLTPVNYAPSRLEYTTTGGSTGIPLGIYYEKGVSRAIEWAFIKTLWERVGYNFRDKCVVLRGNVVKGSETGRYSEYALFGRWLILSSYHMTDQILPGYIKKIRGFRPKFIQALTSTITAVARFMKENDIEPFPSLKAILCGSENLYPWQRELIEEVFQCRVYSWYGHAEMAVLAGECEVSSCYHIFPEYGLVELIGSDGKPVINENELGEVVATSLNNFTCPLIRYRTMDLAVPSNAKCECGRNYALLKDIEGRLQEYFIMGTGHLVPVSIMNMHSDVFDNVKQFQFYQEKKGEVVFNVVRKDTYTNQDTEYIQRELYKKLGGDISLTIHFVNYIPRTESGKYRFLIQKLPIKFGD